MPERTAVVVSRMGLQARPASLVSLAAADTGVPVRLVAKGRSVNAASILDLLALDVCHGEQVTVSADHQHTVDAIVDLLERELADD